MNRRVFVVGAGITGLTVAYRLLRRQDPPDVAVLEEVRQRKDGLEDEHPDDWSSEEHDRREADGKRENQLGRMESHTGRNREARVRVVDPVHSPEKWDAMVRAVPPV